MIQSRIGIDTNILLRLRPNDDPTQNHRIDALVVEHGSTPGSLLIVDVVLAEALRTLRSAYGQSKPAQVAALRSLLSEPAFAFENRATVEQALASFEGSSCAYSDCLIAAKHASLGCVFTATLERGMRKLPGVQLV